MLWILCVVYCPCRTANRCLLTMYNGRLSLASRTDVHVSETHTASMPDEALSGAFCSLPEDDIPTNMRRVCRRRRFRNEAVLCVEILVRVVTASRASCSFSSGQEGCSN